MLKSVANDSCREDSKVPREYMMLWRLQRLLQHIYLCFRCSSIYRGFYSNGINIGHIQRRRGSTSECCCVYFEHRIYRKLQVCRQRHCSTALPDLHHWLVDWPQKFGWPLVFSSWFLVGSWSNEKNIKVGKKSNASSCLSRLGYIWVELRKHI